MKHIYIKLRLLILFMAVKRYNQQLDEVQEVFNDILEHERFPGLPVATAEREEDEVGDCNNIFQVYNIMRSEDESQRCGDPNNFGGAAAAAQGQRRRRMVGSGYLKGQNLYKRSPWTVTLLAKFSDDGSPQEHSLRRVTTGIIIHKLFVLLPTYGLPKGIQRDYDNARDYEIEIIVGMPFFLDKKLGPGMYGSRTITLENIVYFDSAEANDVYYNNLEAHLQFALVRLKQPLTFQDYIQPVCVPAIPILPEDQVNVYRESCSLMQNDQALATGFGSQAGYTGEAILNGLRFTVVRRDEDTGALLLRCDHPGQANCGAAAGDHGAPLLIDRPMLGEAGNQKVRQFAPAMITDIRLPPGQGEAVLPHVIAVDLMKMSPMIAQIMIQQLAEEQQEQAG